MAQAPLPPLALSLGDPAGIGPEIVLKALSDQELADRCVVIGDARHLREIAERHKFSVSIVDANSTEHGIQVFDLSNVPVDAPIGFDSGTTGKAAAIVDSVALPNGL